jgi:hypothetical protein
LHLLPIVLATESLIHLLGEPTAPECSCVFLTNCGA